MGIYYAGAEVVSNNLRDFAIGCTIMGLFFLAIAGFAYVAHKITEKNRNCQQVYKYI